MTQSLVSLLKVITSGFLSLLLLAEVPLSFGEEADGVPFFNDEGKLTLPRESQAELEEAMPEAQLFRNIPAAKGAPSFLAPPG